MTADDLEIASARDLQAVLASMAHSKRMVFFAGLPGVGKSLFIRELVRVARSAGRIVHLLQWDVARPALESLAISAQYPARAGVAHPMVRKAVGRWARRAVLRWHRENPGAAHILIGEVPLIGNRLLDLVQVRADEVESLLTGEDALFVTPVPSMAVRKVIEQARARTISNPMHPREGEDAPPDIVQSAWEEIHSLATAIGAGSFAAGRNAPFDPREYAAVYAHLLRHRPARTLWVNAQLEPRQSVYDLDVAAGELVPSIDEATAVLAELEREYTPMALEEEACRWFHSV